MLRISNPGGVVEKSPRSDLGCRGSAGLTAPVVGIESVWSPGLLIYHVNSDLMFLQERINFDAAPQVTGVDSPSCDGICRAWTSD